ncbi:MAG: hypothetical protein M1347_06230 [Chloroflexi bacterium]|nr:hypothetical protein [Chloroflexota bacterium]
MNLRLRTPFSAAVAIAIGLIVLVSLLFPDFTDLRNRILNWAILLAAVALLLGFANLFQVHFQKMRHGEKPVYSLILLAGMLVTFIITFWEGSQGFTASWIFNSIQLPIETSLMAVLAISLTIAAARLFQQRKDLMSIVFLVTLFVLLLSSGPLFGIELPLFTRTIGPYVNNFLSVGALRGLLIGVSIGTLATGLRILLGADRPYGG